MTIEGKSRGYTRNVDPEDGNTATIQRGRAEATQEQYGDNRERKSRGYTRNGDPEGAARR